MANVQRKRTAAKRVDFKFRKVSRCGSQAHLSRWAMTHWSIFSGELTGPVINLPIAAIAALAEVPIIYIQRASFKPPTNPTWDPRMSACDREADIPESLTDV